MTQNSFRKKLISVIPRLTAVLLTAGLLCACNNSNTTPSTAATQIMPTETISETALPSEAQTPTVNPVETNTETVQRQDTETDSTETQDTEAKREEGAETEAESTDMSVTDITAPELTVPANIYTTAGATIKYKAYATVTDDIDSTPELDIDCSNVNLAEPGEYEVIYTAFDASGNTTQKTVNVIVGWQEEPNVPDEVIDAAADDILSRIIIDGMSDLDKAFAVFYHVRDSYRYIPEYTHWGYRQEAYNLIQTGADSCFANTCLVQLLMERLGYDSIMIEGWMGYNGEHHYWNLISLDGGTSWYHMDTAWWTWMHNEWDLCMLTDDEVAAVSARHGYIYNYDHELYPHTPTEPLW